MIAKILKPILISLFQIVIIVTIHYILTLFYPIQHKSIGFGLTIFYTGIIFSISIFAFNMYLEFSKKYLYLIAFFLFVVSCIFPLETFSERPLRSLFLIFLISCGFLSSILLKNLKK